jgi:hypothetical protein
MTSTDVSPAAVAAMISYLRGACVGYGEEADFIQALSAERDELAARLAEAERARDDYNDDSVRLVHEKMDAIDNLRAANTKLGFVEALDACQRGLALWRDKPHNFKWWNRIDGTPIPNDLLVCIAEILQQTANADRVNLTTANAEIAQMRQQIAWFQAEAAKPSFRVEADFSPPLQEPAHD